MDRRTAVSERIGKLEVVVAEPSKSTKLRAYYFNGRGTIRMQVNLEICIIIVNQGPQKSYASKTCVKKGEI